MIDEIKAIGDGLGDIKQKVLKSLRAGCLLLILIICNLFYHVKNWFEQWFPEHTWLKVSFLFLVICFGIYCVFVFIKRNHD